MAKNSRYSEPNGTFDPDVLARIPILGRHDNFDRWAAKLKRTLAAVNPMWHRLLTGDWDKPTVTHGRLTRDQMISLNKWLSVNTHILLLINQRVDKHLKAALSAIFDAREAYRFLRKTCGSLSQKSGFRLYKKWMGVKYTSGKPAKFVHRWRLALHELNESSPLYKVPWLHVSYQFLTAVEDKLASRTWAKRVRAKRVRLDKECYSTLDLELLIQDFLEFENQRLGYNSDDSD